MKEGGQGDHIVDLQQESSRLAVTRAEWCSDLKTKLINKQINERKENRRCRK